ncbi:hypothetical protein BgiMline_019344 [Biomphalaria glabrata]
MPERLKQATNRCLAEEEAVEITQRNPNLWCVRSLATPPLQFPLNPHHREHDYSTQTKASDRYNVSRSEDNLSFIEKRKSSKTLKPPGKRILERQLPVRSLPSEGQRLDEGGGLYTLNVQHLFHLYCYGYSSYAEVVHCGQSEFPFDWTNKKIFYLLSYLYQ